MGNSPLIWGPNGALNLEAGGIQMQSGQFLANDGQINYLINPGIETGVTSPGWSLGNVALTNNIPTGTPTFGSGSSGNLSLTASTTSAISGTYSLNYISSAATTAGNFVASDAFTIATADQAKVLTFSFYYSTTVGASTANYSGTTSNSFGVAIYDVTNSSWVIPAGIFGMTQSSGVSYCTGTFQTASNGSQYRLVIYNANATTNAITLLFDRFYLGPQIAPLGAIVTDWQSYTPTFTGFGTVSTQSFFYCRVGNTLWIQGTFTSGTSTATTAQISFPSGLVSSSTLLSSSVTVVGKWNNNAANSTFFSAGTMLALQNASVFEFGVESSTLSGVGAANGNQFAASGNTFSLFAQVPIAGWSSNVQTSNTTDTRVVAARIIGCTATVTSTYSDVAFTTVSNDTHAAYSSPNYTIPVTGYYSFTGQVYLSGTAALNNTTNLGLFNTTTSTTLSEITDVYAGAVTGSTGIDFNFEEVFLNAGTQIKIQIKSNITTPTITASTTQNYLQVSRRSGPAVVAATEPISMRYYSSSTTVSSSLTTVVFTNKGWDTHNAYNATTGIWTAPVTGYYQVNTSIAMTGTFLLNSVLDVQVIQTGTNTQTSESKAYSGGAVTQMNTNVGDVFYCIGGDQIKVQTSNSGTSPVLAATSTQNWFSIAAVSKGK